MNNKTKQVIGYKIVRYTYEKKNDIGTLICAFNDKKKAEDYNLGLIQETKHELPTYIYNVEPVHEYFNFIDFLNHA